mgnify:CR=1 FL=1
MQLLMADNRDSTMIDYLLSLYLLFSVLLLLLAYVKELFLIYRENSWDFFNRIFLQTPDNFTTPKKRELYIEYIRYHGSYRDLPLKRILEIEMETYGK